MEVQQPYHVMLDYKGYLIEPRSYRVMPAPLMGTRFATGRQAYANLDFWQVGAMTDFTHGINQKFLVDPSAFFLSLGIDPSRPGEIKLERDLESVTLPENPGVVTAHYRSASAVYLGTSTGKILKSIDGITFTEDASTGIGKIYGFYEIDNKLFATKGPKRTWVYDEAWAEVEVKISGNLAFVNGSKIVDGVDTKFLTELWPGCQILLRSTAQDLKSQAHIPGGSSPARQDLRSQGDVSLIWVEVKSISSDTRLILTENYLGPSNSGPGYRALNDLYFVMVESDYGFGIFNDGIRRSEDGFSWIPFPPDPLWVLPSSEGIALNAVSIPRGFVIGSKRGFWLFVGGSSGMNLWMFPDYVSNNNFKGMGKWGHYAIFSIENQGIFYTDGVSIYPTNLNYLNEGFVFKNCKSVVSSGWDILALVSDGIDWYLARCNLNYAKIPKYWWLVKKLDKVPSHLTSFSDQKVLIHYADETAEVYNKISGPYQLNGYLITSLIDENLIRLQKYYKSISSIFETFPANTSAKLGFRFNVADAFTEKTIVGASQREAVYGLRNPTVENRIQIKLTLITTDTLKSPVVGDLCWTYVLERPSEESAVTRNFYFTILGEDKLEKLTGEVQESGEEEPRTREDIVNDLWFTRGKKQLLNFIGADNKREIGLQIKFSATTPRGNLESGGHLGTPGAGKQDFKSKGNITLGEDSCKITIDRTNYEIKTYINAALDQTINYKDKTIKQIADIINALSDYTCVVHTEQKDSRTAHDLEPVKDREIKATADLYVGTAIHSVIFNPQSPGQVKLNIEGKGSDRINMSLREA